MSNTIIENQLATLDGQKAVFVLDAYSDYPNVLVSDDDGAEFVVNYGRLDQAAPVETEAEKLDAELRKERDQVMIREA